MTLMSVIVAFLFAISLWYLSSNHKVTFVKLKATDLKFLPNRSWHRLIPAGGTFVSATGGTFQSDTPGTFVFAMGGTFDSDMPGTFESDTGGTFNPLLSPWLNENEDEDENRHEEQFAQRKPELIEFTDDMEQFAGVMDDDDQEELDETYNLVYALVEDDEELYAFVGAIESCGSFKDLPAFMHCDAKHVYRLMEKLMRRIRSAKKHGLI